MSWEQNVVAVLCRERRIDPADFDGAWVIAMRDYPPRGRDLGEWRPTLLPEPGAACSHVEFFRAACEDAWRGRRPVLRHLDARALTT